MVVHLHLCLAIGAFESRTEASEMLARKCMDGILNQLTTAGVISGCTAGTFR
jgi:hypothetical protein